MRSDLQTDRLEYIDALRGWAILGVLLVHVWIWQGSSADLLTRIASHGALGVQLFYMVSAFTLLISVHQRMGKGGFGWGRFFIRRFFRVAPLFYVAIIVYGVLRRFAPHYWLPDGINFWHVISALTFTHGWHPKTVNTIVPGGWSMAVEMTFYCLFPLLFYLVTSLQKSLLFMLIALVAGMLISNLAFSFYQDALPHRFGYMLETFAYTFIPSAQICVFAYGFTAFFLLQTRRLGQMSRMTAGFLVLAGLALLLLLLYVDIPVVPHFFVFSAGFCLVLLGLSKTPLPFLVNKPLVYLGKLSYSLYLVHFGVIFILKNLFDPYLDFTSKDLSFIVSFLLVLAGSLSAAWLSYHYVEEPGIRLGKKLLDAFK